MMESERETLVPSEAEAEVEGEDEQQLQQEEQEQDEDMEKEICDEQPEVVEAESEQEQQLPWSKSGLQRCKTAPAMDMAAVLRELQASISKAAAAAGTGSESEEEEEDKQQQGGSGWVVRQAGLLLVGYLLLGLVVYSLNRDQFSGTDTHPVVDALYFCIVTMCTIGYGDIAPLTPATKIFACFFVLIGFGFIDILLSGVVNYVLDLQERALLADFRSPRYHLHPFLPKPRPNNHLLFVDAEKGRMRIRLKVALALGAVVLCIGLGTLVLYFVEGLTWVDSLYLSALSVTTVGYGDMAFSTLSGRLFAAFWLLFSTLAVARAFLYLAEARIDKRQRTLAKWVLQRDITPQDLFAANINNNNFISKSEYVIYKLKEMGKIGDQDISQICNQFKKLDPNNLGRITLPDLLQKSGLIQEDR